MDLFVAVASCSNCCVTVALLKSHVPTINERIAKSGETRENCSQFVEIMQTRRKNRVNETEAPVKWLQCPGCQAMGGAGSFCVNCEDTGLTYSEECTHATTEARNTARRTWTSRLGLSCETLFKGMKVMMIKGPADRPGALARERTSAWYKRYVGSTR
jgi:hypothetical protein